MGFNMNLPYEVTAAGMLIITLIFYNYKNWLDLRKNRIFRDILLAGSIFLAVDSFVEYLAGLCCTILQLYAECVYSICGV